MSYIKFIYLFIYILNIIYQETLLPHELAESSGTWEGNYSPVDPQRCRCYIIETSWVGYPKSHVPCVSHSFLKQCTDIGTSLHTIVMDLIAHNRHGRHCVQWLHTIYLRHFSDNRLKVPYVTSRCLRPKWSSQVWRCATKNRTGMRAYYVLALFKNLPCNVQQSTTKYKLTETLNVRIWVPTIVKQIGVTYILLYYTYRGVCVSNVIPRFVSPKLIKGAFSVLNFSSRYNHVSLFYCAM